METPIKSSQFLRLLKELRPPKKLLMIALALSLFETAASLFVPLFTGNLVDQLAIDAISRTVLILLAAAFLVQVIAGGFSFYFMRSAGEQMTASLREKLWKHVLNLPVSYYDQNESGNTMSRVTQDTNTVKMLITDHLVTFATGIISITGSVIILLYIDWQMTVVMLLSVPAAMLILMPLGRKMYGISKETQNEMASFTGTLSRVLSDIRLVKSYTASEAEYENGRSGIRRLLLFGLKEARIQAIISPFMSLIMMAVLVVLIGYGGVRVASGALSAGSLTSIIIYMFQIVIPVSQMASFFTAFQKAAGATERIQSILQTKTEKPDGLPLSAGRRAIRFERVSFQYETDKPILQDISFSVPEGTTTAIVGPSGSGKTTLFSLLERFYLPAEGTILLGADPIAQFQLYDWRQRIGYVAQESPVMSGSIRDNITYGTNREISDEEIRAAAVQANAFSFIEQLPEQFDTKVGERGVKLSGGQRQRIAIARAILRNPDILLLDEATSSLDSTSEALVQEALNGLMHGRTTLVIAHRLSTVVHADQIVILEHGRVTGMGKHAELLRSHAVYRELAQKQDLQGPS
ncbi:ABC transporter ATP-binding protein [Domibacillus indicus]|uniref:ABC transporter ATP-binding protein n=1 Tax=Domibacillus indicus TaxID=1437523 RepID=UPI00061815AA|nr:ABC transporter ATP-binding protein [Domibacillus indicus]